MLSFKWKRTSPCPVLRERQQELRSLQFSSRLLACVTVEITYTVFLTTWLTVSVLTKVGATGHCEYFVSAIYIL